MAADPAAQSLAATDDPGDGDRVLRVMSRFIGAGFLAYLLVALPEIGPDAAIVAAWWTPVALILAFGPGIALLLSTFWAGLRWLPRWGAVCACAYPIAVLLWLPAWNDQLIDSSRSTWLVNFSGLTSLAAALAWRPMWTFVHLVFVSAAVAFINELGRGGRDAIGVQLVYETTWAVAFSMVFLVAAIMALRTGRLLDATRANAQQVTAAAAASKAQAAERARFDSLTHDHVLATLLAAEGANGSEKLAKQAAAALAELDRLSLPDDQQQNWWRSADVAASLRAAVSAASDLFETEVRIHPGAADMQYPAAAVRALGEAIGEASRNSSVHAGRDADRVVLIEILEAQVRAVVADNGVGFDPVRVPPGRLGIKVSIMQRMIQIDGGSALVDARPGGGTSVQVGWVARS